MKIYLAAAYANKEAMRAHRDVLQSMGHDVVSSWLDTEHSPSDKSADCLVEDAPYEAEKDLQEVYLADILVAFTGGSNRGGRHVEFGYGMASGNVMVLIGEPEHIFHHHSSVFRYETFEGFIKAMQTRKIPIRLR